MAKARLANSLDVAAGRFAARVCGSALRRWRLCPIATLCRLKLAEGGLLAAFEDGEEEGAEAGEEEEEEEEEAAAAIRPRQQEDDAAMSVVALVVRSVNATRSAKHGHSAALSALRAEVTSLSSALDTKDAELGAALVTAQSLRDEHCVVSERERRLEATVTVEVCSLLFR
jgi:hypothetical protein